MLPDTLGVLNPDTTYKYCKEIQVFERLCKRNGLGTTQWHFG